MGAITLDVVIHIVFSHDFVALLALSLHCMVYSRFSYPL